MKAYAGGSGGGGGYPGVTPDGSNGLDVSGWVNVGGGAAELRNTGEIIGSILYVGVVGDMSDGGFVLLPPGTLSDAQMLTAGAPRGIASTGAMYCSSDRSLWVWDGAGWHKI